MILLAGFRNLFRNVRRSFTVVFTIALGVSALFLFHGFNTGTVNQYREDMIRSRYAHGQVHTAGYREVVREKPWQQWMQNPQETIAFLRSHPQVKQVFPRLEFFALISNGSRSVSARGQAVDGVEEAKFFTALNVEEGKNLSDEEDGLLIGKGIATALGAKIGDSLSVLTNTIHGSINGVDLVVTGIFHTGVKEFDDSYFRVQLPKGAFLLDTTAVESIAVGLTDYSDWEGFENFVRSQRPEFEAVSFAVLDKVYYQHTIDWLDAQFQFIQGIILFIVFLGILNTVSSAVLERKQEIGNLRANGESRWDVLRLLACESFFLGVAGALAGVLLAYLLTYTVLAAGIPMPPGPGQTRAFSTFIELQADFGLRAFVFGIAACLLGTVAAGYKVLTLSVADALRSA